MFWHCFQNVTYEVVDEYQVCKGPKPTSDYWTNSSLGPVAPPFSYVGGRQWGYACPDGTYCVDYGNPSLGGYRNFDNILFTWFQLLQHMAPCNWDYIMYDTQGAMSWWTWLLHIPITFFGLYLLTNLTIAVIVINFNKTYEKMSLIKSMSNGHLLQSNLYDENSFRDLPSESKSVSKTGWPVSLLSSIKTACKRIQASRTFELIVITAILLNVIALSIVWYGMPLIAIRVLDGANYAFTMVFVLEMMIKLIGLGAKEYASDHFNAFDGLITILSVIEMALALSGSSFAAISAFRAARVLRLFR